jgi:tetratricopeptide (TPR) repeat protein
MDLLKKFVWVGLSPFVFLLFSCQTKKESFAEAFHRDQTKEFLSKTENYEVDSKLLLAQDYLMQGKFQEAFPLFEQVFQKQPTRTAGAHLASLALAFGKTQKSRDVIDTLLLLYPDDESIHFLSLRAYLAEGETEKFQKAIASAMTSFPNEWSFVELQVKIWIAQGKKTKSLEQIQAFLQKNPHEKQALWFQAELLFQMKQYKKSLNTLDLLIDLDPTDSKVWIFKGVIALQTRNLKLASQSLREALSLDPSLSDVREVYFEVLNEQGDEHLLQALWEIKKEFAGSFVEQKFTNLLIFLMSLREECDQAIQVYENEKSFFSIEVNLALSNCYAYRGKWKKAFALLDESLKKSPQAQSFIFLQKASLETLKLDFPRAKKTLSKVPRSLFFKSFELDTSYLKVLERLDVSEAERFGQALQTVYKTPEAFFVVALLDQGTNPILKRPEKIQAFLKQFPEFPSALNSLAYSYIHEKDPSLLLEAEKMVAEMLRQKPHEPNFLDTKATLLLKQKKPKDALLILEPLVKSQNNPVISFHQALALKELKFFDQSLEILLKLKNFFDQQIPGKLKYEPEWDHVSKKIPSLIVDLKQHLIEGA